MRNLVLLLGFVLLLLAGIIGWQFAACYVANTELQSDLKDLAVQNSYRIGLTSPPTEEGLREAVITRAKDHGIRLEPRQVTVQLTITPEALSISLAADYEAHVNLLVYSFPLHFNPSSSYSAKVIVK
jgi:hypothetical protein